MAIYLVIGERERSKGSQPLEDCQQTSEEVALEGSGQRAEREQRVICC